MGKPYNQFSAEPFVNAVGQTINPGDRVAYVTMGYNKRVNQNTGWFDGVLKDPKNGKVVFTRVRGINTRKTMKTGKVLTSTSTYPEWSFQENKYIQRSYKYPETVVVDVEPYGKTNLQRHRLFKI